MRQGREYLSGERVTDVSQHPAFADAARTVAGAYDLACDPANDMTYEPDESGESVARTRLANTVFTMYLGSRGRLGDAVA